MNCIQYIPLVQANEGNDWINLLTAMLGALLGVAAAFLVTELIAKERFASKYAFVLSRMMAKSGGAYEQMVSDSKKVIATYSKQVTELKEIFDRDESVLPFVRKMQVPTLSITLEYDEISQLFNSSALTKLPKELIAELVRYVKTYKRIEVGLQNASNHYQLGSDYFSKSVINEEPSRAVLWHQGHLDLLNTVQQDLHRLALDGDKVTEILVAKQWIKADDPY